MQSRFLAVPPFRLRTGSLWLACAIACSAWATEVQPVLVAQQTVQATYAIAAGSLDTVLGRFAAQSGIALSFDPALARDLQSPGLQGRYTVAEGFAVLLAGTSLETVPQGAGQYTLRRAPAAAAAQRAGAAAATLPSVTVQAPRVVETQEIDVRDRVQHHQAKEVRDLFSGEANAEVAGGTRNGQRLFIRGVEGSQLNITVDGARQGANLYNHRGGLNNVDPEILKRVEINAGPPAADEGYGALGGSVRFETIDAQDRLTSDRRAGGFAKAGVASANDSTRVGAAAYGLVGEHVGLLAYTSRADAGDLRVGGGDKVPFSAGDDQSTLLKFSLLNAGGHSLRLGWEDNKADGFNYMQRGDYPYQVQPPTASRPPQQQMLRRQAATARYDFDSGSPWLKLRATTASSETDFNAPNSQAERFVSKVRNFDLRNEMSFDFGGMVNRTVVGFDTFKDDGSSAIINRATTYTGTENKGLYLQSRFTGARWRFEAGVRHDSWDTDLKARTASGDATSYNAKGAFDIGQGFTVFGGVGESARGYSTIPLQFTRNIGNTLTLNGQANGSLTSETSRLSEVGARWQGRNGTAQTGAEFKLYDNRIKNAILYRQPGSGGLGGLPVTDFYNHNQTVRFHGFEISGDWTQGAWSTRASFARPKMANLPLAPQFLARYGAPTGGKLVWDTRWQWMPGLTLGYALTHVRSLKDVPAGQAIYIPRAGYTLHDLQLLWKPQGERGLSLAVAVNNLSDKRYSNQTTLTENRFATEEAGRNVMLTAGWTF